MTAGGACLGMSYHMQRAKCMPADACRDVDDCCRRSMAVIVANVDGCHVVVANGVFIEKDLVVFIVEDTDAVEALKKKEIGIRTFKSAQDSSKNIDLDIKILEYDPETCVLVARVGTQTDSFSPAKISTVIPSLGSEYLSVCLDKSGEFQLSKTFTIAESISTFRDRTVTGLAYIQPGLVSYRSNLNGRPVC